MNALDIRKKRKTLGLTQKELAKILGVSGNTIINWEKGEVIPQSKHTILYNFLNSNIEDLEDVGKESKLKTEVKQVPFEDFMEAEYLPAQAQAGYLSSLEENNHLDLETILVPKEFEKGNYTVVEIVGSSMDDGTTRSICDGDKLLVKELEDNLLNKLLPYRQYLFVIVSRDGIVCKQITNHNMETGNITCHSFNNTHSDYEINLKDVFRIFFVKKIVERRINF